MGSDQEAVPVDAEVLMQMHRHRGCRRFADADDRDIRRMDDRQLDLRQHPPKRQRSKKPGAPAADHDRTANRLRHLDYP